MADKKISALTGASTPLAGTEVLPIVQSGATVKVAVSDLTAGRAISATQITLTAGNVIPASGYGIDFSATPGTGTSELLADYEEGTWAPVLYSGATDATMNGATSGRYTKVGRAVHIQAYVQTTSVAGIGGGAISIKGLPFAVPNLYSSYGGVTGSWGGNLNVLPGQSVGLTPEAGTSAFTIYLWSATTGSVGMTGTQWTNTGYVAFSLTYFV